MEFLKDVRRRAAANPRRIVFPESADTRTLTAVEALLGDRIVHPVLLLDPARPQSHAAARAVGAEVVDPGDASREETVAHALLAFAQGALLGT